MKKLLRFLKELLRAALDELHQIQNEELFIHNWRGDKWKK